MMLRLHRIDRRSSRITELPDDIVVSIVSFLTIKEAIATSILSRRWRHLWKYTTGSWRFNFYQVCEVINGIGMGFTDEDKEWKEQSRKDYVTRVNQALESHCGPFLYELSICCYPDSLYSYYRTKIDNWISIASRKCVRRLYLGIRGLWFKEAKFSQLTHLTLKGAFISENTLDYYLSSCPLLEHLCVIQCIGLNMLRVSGGSLLKLKHLEVSGAFISQNTLDYYLSSCPLLEHLCLIQCVGLNMLRVSGGSLLKLKHLEVSDCWSLKYLDIAAPNLESFVGTKLRCATALLRDVPLLSTLSFDNLWMIKPLSYVSQIESFAFVLESWGLSSLKTLPDLDLSNLKHLELRIEQDILDSFLPYTCLLKASPLLSSLKIDLGSFRNGFRMSMGWRDRVKFYDKKYVKHDQAAIYRDQHPCLRVVTLCGFLGYERHTEFALHLIGMATSLEKMVIDCSQEIRDMTPEHWREERSIARQSAEELRTKLLPTTKFILP